MAAVDDPWTVDTQLRQLIAAHQDILDRQPPDRSRQLDHAARELAGARTRLATAEAAVDDVRHRLDRLGVLAPLTRRGRGERRALEDSLQQRQHAAADAARAVTAAAARLQRLTREQHAHDQHEQTHGWRRDAIDDVSQRLDQHWTDVALACVRADQPLAHGVEPLRLGRRHLADQLATIEASLPPDRNAERERARTSLRARTTERYTAERQLARSQAMLDEQLARRWPRRDKAAIAHASDEADAARKHLRSSEVAEISARNGLAALDRHQKARDVALTETAIERHALTRDLAHLDIALHHTRIERVQDLVDHPTPLHLELLGPPPTGPVGRAVWCHQVNRLEHHLDHDGGARTAWQRLLDDLRETPTLARFADHHVAIEPHHQLRPSEWASITEHAAAMHAATIDHAMARPARALDIDLGF